MTDRSLRDVLAALAPETSGRALARLGLTRLGQTGLGLAALLVVLAGAGLLAGPAVAGDAIALYELEPETVDAEPGETVEIDVVLHSDGGYAGEGIGNYQFVVAVDPDVATIESVEPGPFLAGDGGEVNGTTTEVADGAVRVEHERVGADDGQTGNEVAATISLSVRDDAPAANATVDVVEPETHLAPTDSRLRSFGRTATVRVDGGGETYEPPYASDEESDGAAGESDEDGPGVTTATAANRSVGENEDDSDDGVADAVPGFGALAAVGALSALLAVLAIGARRRDSL